MRAFVSVCVHLSDLQSGYVIEAFLEVGLHGGRVARLPQDLQQVVVGQEVEPGEHLPLGLQVHVQCPLDLLQLHVHLHQLLLQA